MPYLKEDEIVINGKTVNSNASDVDDADESFFENKVKGRGEKTFLFAFGVLLFALLCVALVYRFFFCWLLLLLLFFVCRSRVHFDPPVNGAAEIKLGYFQLFNVP